MAASVLFLIRSLNVGGAERQLVALARGLHRRGVRVKVVTFYDGGTLTAQLLASGVPVIHLGKSHRWDVLPFIARLVREIRTDRPDVLYSFLPTANLLAVLTRPLTGVRKVFWGVRASNLDGSRYDRLARQELRLASHLSRFADAIICNSMAGFEYHVRHGYPRTRMSVVPNGIDTEVFRFDAAARRRRRLEWRVADEEVLVGLVARFDPMKDHDNFIHAAQLLSERVPFVRFACVGGNAEGTGDLRRLIATAGLEHRVLLLGEQSDMASVYSALDVASSSSAYGEGFSNATAEAMACECVCAVTDVGDAARIVGDTGRVVAPGSPDSLAAAWQEIIAMSVPARRAAGKAARLRVESMFTLDHLIEQSGVVLGLW